MKTINRIDPNLTGVAWTKTSKERPIAYRVLDTDKDMSHNNSYVCPRRRGLMV